MVGSVLSCPITAGIQCVEGYVGKLSFQHTDNLGSGNVETDQQGQVTELSDNYSFGEKRTELRQEGNLKEQRFYTGHELDSNGLTYANQRYINTRTGTFLSEDIVCRQVSQKEFVFDPQALNCYSYGLNNPFRYTDPSGVLIESLIDIILLALSARDYYTNRTLVNPVSLLRLFLYFN